MKQVAILLNWAIHKSSFDFFLKKKRHDYQSATFYKPLDDKSVHYQCLKGYEGNSYFSDGCQDIDECNMKNTTCQSPAVCKNHKGGYGCYSSRSPKAYIIIIGM